jgi:dCMP deaminase
MCLSKRNPRNRENPRVYSGSINIKWDLRFLELAKLVSTWSKDPSTKTGAVIVRPDKTIASIGYNGFPKTMPDNSEWYANREEKYSRIVHCEINALIHAREPVQEYTLFTWPLAPCDRCAVQMLQAGIKRFVFPEPTEYILTRWASAFEKTKRYITESGATYTEYKRCDLTKE